MCTILSTTNTKVPALLIRNVKVFVSRSIFKRGVIVANNRFHMQSNSQHEAGRFREQSSLAIITILRYSLDPY